MLVLEQFDIAHDRGSSHGESRIFRYAYDKPAYVRLAQQCKVLWRRLEAEAGTLLLHETGGLDIGEDERGRAEVLAVQTTLEAAGCAAELLDRTALRRRFGQWQVHEDALAVYSPDTGVLEATRCVQTLVQRATAHGAIIRDHEAVEAIFPEARHVVVVTARGRYQGRRLIITAGAWSTTVVGHLGLQLPLCVSQEQTVYFQPRAHADRFKPERFPVWFHHRADEVYGFPVLGLPGIKLAFHHDRMVLNSIDEYTRVPRADVTERLRAYLEQYLPEAAGESFQPTTCLYTTTPDQDFIVDTLPGLPHIAIGAGFSGHGFKFGIGIGRALADLVIHGQTDMEIGHLGIARFLPAT